MKFQRGFTLIELLVVISIISLLSSVVLASVRDARSKAQQSAYRSYLGEVVNAIELYKSSNNGSVGSSWDEEPLQDVIETHGLATYIDWSAPPEFVDGTVSTYTEIYSWTGNHTCGGIDLKQPGSYAIMFSSTNFDLQFPVYDYTGKVAGPYEEYCISDVRK